MADWINEQSHVEMIFTLALFLFIHLVYNNCEYLPLERCYPRQYLKYRNKS